MGETVGSPSAAGQDWTPSWAMGRVREPLLSSRGAAASAAYADEQLDKFFALLRRTYVDLGPDAVGSE